MSTLIKSDFKLPWAHETLDIAILWDNINEQLTPGEMCVAKKRAYCYGIVRDRPVILEEGKCVMFIRSSTLWYRFMFLGPDGHELEFSVYEVRSFLQKAEYKT